MWPVKILSQDVTSFTNKDIKSSKYKEHYDPSVNSKVFNLYWINIEYYGLKVQYMCKTIL